MEFKLSNQDVAQIADAVWPEIKKRFERAQLEQEQKIKHPLGNQWMSVQQIRQELPRAKNGNWIREVLLEGLSHYKQFSKHIELHHGKGKPSFADPRLIEWIQINSKAINWNAKSSWDVYHR